MHAADHDLSPEAEAQIDGIVEEMLANDRENERLRREIARIVAAESPA
jgi:hypothetical protein